MLSCCKGRVLIKSRPMFGKKWHHKALTVLSFNIGQNQINPTVRGHLGKKQEEKTDFNPKVTFTK